MKIQAFKSWIVSVLILILVFIAIPLCLFFAKMPTVYFLVYLGIVTVCLGIYLFFFFYRPLQNISDYISQIAQGDFGIPIKKVVAMPCLVSVTENLHYISEIFQLFSPLCFMFLFSISSSFSSF